MQIENSKELIQENEEKFESDVDINSELDI